MPLSSHLAVRALQSPIKPKSITWSDVQFRQCGVPRAPVDLKPVHTSVSPRLVVPSACSFGALSNIGDTINPCRTLGMIDLPVGDTMQSVSLKPCAVCASNSSLFDTNALKMCFCRLTTSTYDPTISLVSRRHALYKLIH